jgi:cell division septation protein DedD
MPEVQWSDWRLPAMIVGTALVALLLGSAVTIWLGTKPLPAIAGADPPAQATAGAVGASQSTGLPWSAGNSAQTPTAQAAAGGVGSGAQTAGSTAGSVAQRPVSPVPAPSSAGAAATQSGSYSLQLGAFLDAVKAKLLADQIAARGYTPIAIDAADRYGRTWHYVRLGAFADERAASLGSADLLGRAGIGSVVVRLSAADAGR